MCGGSASSTTTTTITTERETEHCGGTQALSLAHEMVRLAKSDPDKNGWMLKEVKGQTKCEANDLDLSRKFDLETAAKALSKASHGDMTPNPELSNLW